MRRFEARNFVESKPIVECVCGDPGSNLTFGKTWTEHDCGCTKDKWWLARNIWLYTNRFQDERRFLDSLQELFEFRYVKDNLKIIELLDEIHKYNNKVMK